MTHAVRSIPTLALETFARHLFRGLTSDCKIVGWLPGGAIGAWVTSASEPGIAYLATARGCTCRAGQRGVFCKHRALVLEASGAADEVAPGWYEKGSELLTRLESMQRATYN